MEGQRAGEGLTGMEGLVKSFFVRRAGRYRARGAGRTALTRVDRATRRATLGYLRSVTARLVCAYCCVCTCLPPARVDQPACRASRF